MIDHHFLEPVAPAPVRALVPLATVRSYLELPDSSQDATLTRLIGVVSRAFAGQQGLRRPPLRGTWLERNAGDGGHLLILHRWPVESVSSVLYGIEDPETIEATEYSIIGEQRRTLWRQVGWIAPALAIAAGQAGGAEPYAYSTTYVAGWLPPGSGAGTVSTWLANTPYVVGAFVKPVAGAGLLLFEATTGGTSHASDEPTWPTTVGGTIVDGMVTWTARRAEELPEDIQEAALLTIKQWFDGGLDIMPGIQSESAEGYEVTYDFVGARRRLPSLPPFAAAVLGEYR